jgi:hypothetical protein
MTTLTERYVAATLRAVPPRQRDEIERELRAAIADAVDEQGEVAALTALGDPARLAASYSEKPLQLIGPRIYLDYRRVLSILLTSVVPLIFLAVAVTSFRTDSGLGPAVWSAANAALLVAMHLVIWATLLFAIIERRAPTTNRRGAWDPASLPEPTARRIDLGSVIGGSVVTAVIATVLIVAQSGDVGPVTAPLWNSGALLIVVVFAAVAIGLDVIGYYVGWGMPQAITSILLSVLFTVGVVITARNGLLNPVFFDGIGWVGAAGANGFLTWIVIVLVVLMGLSYIAGALKRARPSTANQRIAQ